MVSYEFIVKISDSANGKPDFRIIRDFETEFAAKQELTNIGKNGLIYENIYYPPHKILEIEFNKL